VSLAWQGILSCSGGHGANPAGERLGLGPERVEYRRVGGVPAWDMFISEGEVSLRWLNSSLVVPGAFPAYLATEDGRVWRAMDGLSDLMF
jgi:hypothetical protein